MTDGWKPVDPEAMSAAICDVCRKALGMVTVASRGRWVRHPACAEKAWSEGRG